MNKPTKTAHINVRVSPKLKKAVQDACKIAPPEGESETQFVERACWERIKRIKKGKG